MFVTQLPFYHRHESEIVEDNTHLFKVRLCYCTNALSQIPENTYINSQVL